MMDLTPLEVRKKKGDFRRQIRGYDPESVDDFLDLVADRMEQLVRDNATLLETSGRLEHQVSEYREREKALTEALVSAQQLREEMRVKAVKEAEAARSQAEKDADEHRSLAAEEAEQARREAREILERAQAEARRELEDARNQAEAEAARIRAEIDRTRDRESATIHALQERRVMLLDSYRTLLEREMAELAMLPAVRGEVAEVHDEVVVSGDAEAASNDDTIRAEEAEGAELPEMSADLAALIEAAESDVDDLAWSSSDEEVVVEVAPEADPELEESEPEGLLGAADGIDDVVDERLFGADTPEEVDELVLEAAEEPVDDVVPEEVEDDDSWLSSLVDDAPPAPQAEQPTARRPAWEQEEVGDGSDEDFIDSLIAQAGVTPAMSGSDAATSGEPPAFLDEVDDMAAVLETEAVAEVEDEPGMIELLDEEPIADVAIARAEPQPQDDASSREDEPAEIAAETGNDDEPGAGTDPLDSIDVLDGDDGFDALFGDGDDDPADFDFDAALATATGFGAAPESVRTDADNAFDLGIELDDTKSPLDLGRGGAGPFGSLEDLGFGGNRNGFSPTSRGELTLRPLSPEEEAPDLPAESRPRDESDDDMFSTMFRGRE